MKTYRAPTIIFSQLLTILILIFCTQSSSASTPAQLDQIHHFLRHGIDRALNMEIQEAVALFQQAIDLDGEDPMGYAFQSLAYLFSLEMMVEPQALKNNEEHMLSCIRESIARGKKRVEKNAQDGRAYFAMTMAMMVQARSSIRGKSFLRATHDTSLAWEYMKKAKDANPQAYDVELPMGMLHYHIDQLSRVARFFSSLMIAPGDHELGIQELGLAAQKGDLLTELAKAELLAVYVNYEKQPAKALPYALELREKFPKNYNIAFGLAVTLSELHRSDEALAVAKEIETGIRSGKAPYIPQLQARFDNLMGRIFFNQKEYAKAEESFHKVLKDDSPYNALSRASALLRLGMICDVRQERNEAESYYSRVLETENVGSSAEKEAKQYLSTPFVPR